VGRPVNARLALSLDATERDKVAGQEKYKQLLLSPLPA